MPSYSIDTAWYADTGATDHLTGELDKLSMKQPYTGKDNVHTANGAGMQILHVGQAALASRYKTFKLRNVLHVPSVTRNLLSVRRFTTDNHVSMEFYPNHLLVKDLDTRNTVLSGHCRGDLYAVNDNTSSSCKSVFSGVRTSSEQWHCRLGHPALPIVQHVLNSRELPVDLEKNVTTCV